MANAGHPLDAAGLRVISNFPIWVAETQRVASLALPDEPPADVLDLAATFPGTRYLILTNPEGKHWPGDLEAGLTGAECFSLLDLDRTLNGHGPARHTTVTDRMPVMPHDLAHI